jgi:hypothetical protein
MNVETRQQAIVIAAAIFAARDLAKDWNGGHSPRAIAAAANAIDKAKFLVEEIERRTISGYAVLLRIIQYPLLPSRGWYATC